MVDFVHVNAHSSLHGLERRGSNPTGPSLCEVWPFSAIQIAWKSGSDEDKIAKVLNVDSLPIHGEHSYAMINDGAGALVLPLMPQRVLAVSATPLDNQVLETLLDIGAYPLDLTQGRTLFNLKGEGWRWVLMKGAGVDFETLQPGRSVQTDLFKIPTLIWVKDPDQVCLLVSYNYARSLAGKILEAGRDQNLTIGSAEFR